MVIYGAGSIGSTIGGWMTPNYPSVHLIARREHADVMKEEGLTLSGPDEGSENISVNVIKDLSEIADV
ncbi:MAG: ketopantoate reductase family protein, partial [Candidatus Korarchaeota archaeon]|nr:ketopantoate reductase family protein [Candidatus Korarchaeota archaeon]